MYETIGSTARKPVPMSRELSTVGSCAPPLAVSTSRQSTSSKPEALRERRSAKSMYHAELCGRAERRFCVQWPRTCAPAKAIMSTSDRKTRQGTVTAQQLGIEV